MSIQACDGGDNANDVTSRTSRFPGLTYFPLSLFGCAKGVLVLDELEVPAFIEDAMTGRSKSECDGMRSVYFDISESYARLRAKTLPR
jgi:hypothetical protein